MPQCQEVSPHHRGRRKTHFLVRTSTIFGADVHDPKGSRKTLFRKIRAPIKIKSALRPPPPPNPPPKKEEFYGHRFSCRKNAFFPGVHKIGAAISGPRIADTNFTDTGTFLICTKKVCVDFLAPKPGKDTDNDQSSDSEWHAQQTACLDLAQHGAEDDGLDLSAPAPVDDLRSRSAILFRGESARSDSF